MSPLAAGSQLKIYRDRTFFVIETATALPRRCYKCNSREIVQKYESSYFSVKGFGKEFLSSFPNWTNYGGR